MTVENQCTIVRKSAAEGRHGVLAVGHLSHHGLLVEATGEELCAKRMKLQTQHRTKSGAGGLCEMQIVTVNTQDWYVTLVWVLSVMH
jgi:hypothetical protein